MRYPEGYTLPREIVIVPRRLPEYAPYLGACSLAGYNSAADKETIDGKLAIAWRDMMARCYDDTYKDYHKYGDIGAFVVKEWHNLATFITQVQLVPHWSFKLQAWQSFALDKDYYGACCYGPLTSVWMHTLENNTYVRHAVPLIAVHCDGRRKEFLTYAAAAQYFGVHKVTMLRAVRGDATPKALTNWDVSVLDDGLLRRYKLCI